MKTTTFADTQKANKTENSARWSYRIAQQAANYAVQQGASAQSIAALKKREANRKAIADKTRTAAQQTHTQYKKDLTR